MRVKTWPANEEAKQVMKKAIIKDYNSATHTATVQIAGSLCVWLEGVPVSRGIPADVMAVGHACAVLFLDESNPNDAVVAAVFGS